MIQACSGRAADVAVRRALVCGHPDPAAELPHWQRVRRRLQARPEQAVLAQVVLPWRRPDLFQLPQAQAMGPPLLQRAIHPPLCFVP